MTKEKDSSKIHKVLTIVGAVLCIILIPILIINIVLITKSFTNEEEVPNIGGITPLIVLTDSMVPEIYSGDLIITDVEEAKNIKVNDVISFFDPAGNGTSVVTHRVVEIIEENGKLSFRTRGDNNNTDDKMLVPESKLIGVCRQAGISRFPQKRKFAAVHIVFRHRCRKAVKPVNAGRCGHFGNQRTQPIGPGFGGIRHGCLTVPHACAVAVAVQMDIAGNAVVRKG